MRECKTDPDGRAALADDEAAGLPRDEDLDRRAGQGLGHARAHGSSPDQAGHSEFCLVRGRVNSIMVVPCTSQDVKRVFKGKRLVACPPIELG